MAPRTVEKVGKVRIKLQYKDLTYYLAWPNPNGGNQLMESTGYKATTDKQRMGESIPLEVRKKAAGKDREISAPGYCVRSHNGPTISEAMTEAISRCRAKTERRHIDLGKFADYFGDFIEIAFPRLMFWTEVRPSHVHAYIEFQHGRKLTAKSLKHYISIATLTANYWCREDPDKFRPLNIQSRHLVEESKPAKAYLDAVQLSILLQYAQESKNPGLMPAVMLGGYAGMNILEILRLRPEDFDHKAGTVSIKRSKNRFRERTIPLLPFVAEWAKTFKPITKVNGSLATDLSLGKAVRHVLDKAGKNCTDKAQRPAFLAVAPKDMRKSFANLCRAARVREEALGAYIGHRPQSMTGRVYADYGEAAYLRQEVLTPLAEHLAAAVTGNVVDIKSA